MLLTILIPTYNRVNFLKKNCLSLVEIINKHQLSDKIKIIISNNQSPDATEIFLDEFSKNSNINIDIIHQKENIGSVKNVLFLLDKSTTEYIVFLGDDDYLHEQYLPTVIKLISEKSSNISSIIPSNLAISEDGEILGFSRDVNMASNTFDAGFESCLINSWRGHQLSGLLFKREGLSTLCKTNSICNMYLFIYLVAVSSLRGRLIHLTEYPVKVSQPSQQAKGWSYDYDGLISHIFDNYKQLPEISKKQRMLLELKILDEQYWRYVMYIKKGPIPFIRAIKSIVFGKNTSLFTRFAFPLLMPYFILKRITVLLLNGDLIKTLKRPVDI